MSLARQVPRRKRRKKIAKAVPIIGAAGLSLSLTAGASAAIAETTPAAPHAATSYEITLGEEDISDVSLATFCVFDKENSPASRPRVRLAMGGGGGGGGGCWTGTYYTSPAFGDKGNPQQAKPTRKHPRTAKPALSSKNSE